MIYYYNFKELYFILIILITIRLLRITFQITPSLKTHTATFLEEEKSSNSFLLCVQCINRVQKKQEYKSGKYYSHHLNAFYISRTQSRTVEFFLIETYVFVVMQLWWAFHIIIGGNNLSSFSKSILNEVF